MIRTLDTLEFTRTAGVAEGSAPVSALPRLASLLADDSGEIAFRAEGRREPRPEGGGDSFLSLSLEGRVRMGCVRCLKPVEVALEVRRDFRLARSEEEAERLDLEDEDCDVVAGSRRFDLMGLVEDEAILGLPPMPRHSSCALPAEPEPAPEEPVEETRKPFAALAGLKGRPQ